MAEFRTDLVPKTNKKNPPQFDIKGVFFSSKLFNERNFCGIERHVAKVLVSISTSKEAKLFSKKRMR